MSSGLRERLLAIGENEELQATSGGEASRSTARLEYPTRGPRQDAALDTMVVFGTAIPISIPGREWRHIAKEKGFRKKSGFCKYTKVGGLKPYYNPVKTAYLLLIGNMLFWFERPGETHPQLALFLENLGHIKPVQTSQFHGIDLVSAHFSYRLMWSEAGAG
ncbi:hypothetical protein CYMTET_6649 [Cymbomonas tetramitiformis]|uniref:Uncharacterized protein n=1 Tax=Cymbomonas tetramitiformis TaxID=36881 RepID=A0AAE0GWN1_9CHLO|nr:hypothetical protein CYMTET_6649 [Cymbomonas tetramitiformis]